MKLKLIAALAVTTLISGLSTARAAITATLIDRRDLTTCLSSDTETKAPTPVTGPSLGASTGDHSDIGQPEEMAKKKAKKKKKKTAAS